MNAYHCGKTKLRELFLLRPDVVFLNHGSFGACPCPVFDTYQQWQRELEEQPVEFLGRRFTSLMRTTRSALAAYLHADPDDLVFVPHATTRLNIVAHSLTLKPGDEVLSTDHEYGALDRMWCFLYEKWGSHYVNSTVPPAGYVSRGGRGAGLGRCHGAHARALH